MIESIQSTAIPLPSINNQNTTPLEMAKPSDISSFNSILQQAQSADMNALSINLSKGAGSHLAGVENSLVDKFININKSYNSRKQHIADIREVISSSSHTTKEAPAIATTSDIRQFSENSKIRTNLEPENKTVSIIEDAQKKLLEASQESTRKSQLIGDRFVQIAAWRTNMAIFTAALKSMRSGFETLFRSSG